MIEQSLGHAEPSLYEQILDISRQKTIGPLSPWFDDELRKRIIDGSFVTPVNIDLIGDRIVDRLSRYRIETRCDTAVLGMSGGVDSALTAALAKRAGYRVVGLTLPIHQDPIETQRGVEACEALGLEHLNVDLSSLYDQTLLAVGDDHLAGDDVNKAIRIRRGNIRARLRMVTLYNHASKHGGFVLSTDNFSELSAGFWTIHGDVGDVSPIQSLWKSWEVPMLSKMVGVPETTWRAKPTDGLGVDQGDEAQLGVSYLEWDLTIMAMAELAQDNPDEFVLRDRLKKIGIDDDHPVLSRMGRTWFKRKNPLIFDHPLRDRLEMVDRIDSYFMPTSAVL